MSLVSTYVEDQDGKWYKNPVIMGDDWFICWDDDDPIELVMLKHVECRDVISELKKLGWDLTVTSKASHSGRMFPPTSKGRISDAKSFFLKQAKLGPSAILMKGLQPLKQKPDGQGVYYSSSPNGNGGFF